MLPLASRKWEIPKAKGTTFRRPAIDRPCFGDLANMAENKMREIKAIPVP